jgi:hypothetical protein
MPTISFESARVIIGIITFRNIFNFNNFKIGKYLTIENKIF